MLLGLTCAHDDSDIGIRAKAVSGGTEHTNCVIHKSCYIGINALQPDRGYIRLKLVHVIGS